MVTSVGFCVRDTAVTMVQTARSVISEETNNIDTVIRDMDPGEVSRTLEIKGTQAMEISTLHTPEHQEMEYVEEIRLMIKPVKQMK